MKEDARGKKAQNRHLETLINHSNLPLMDGWQKSAIEQGRNSATPLFLALKQLILLALGAEKCSSFSNEAAEKRYSFSIPRTG